MTNFKIWLLYCMYCNNNGISAPTYGDFMNGHRYTFVDFGLNI